MLEFLGDFFPNRSFSTLDLPNLSFSVLLEDLTVPDFSLATCDFFSGALVATGGGLDLLPLFLSFFSLSGFSEGREDDALVPLEVDGCGTSALGAAHPCCDMSSNMTTSPSSSSPVSMGLDVSVNVTRFRALKGFLVREIAVGNTWTILEEEETLVGE